MTKAALTESDVLALLRERHNRPGNGGGGEYAFMTHVRNAAGFEASRTFDAVAMSLWPSRGLSLHAFEVKCSRGDWLREMKEPAKAEAAARVCDRFSVVAATDTIVAEGELPLTWGLLVVRGGKLVCVKDAPLLPDGERSADTSKRAISRSFLVALLRSAGAVPKTKPADIEAAEKRGSDRGAAAMQGLVDSAKAETAELRSIVNDFERESGVAIRNWYRSTDPAKVGAALRGVLNGDAESDRALQRIRDSRKTLLIAAESLAQLLPAEVSQ